MSQAAAKKTSLQPIEGDKAPDVKLPTDSGETFDLSALKGTSNAIIYFYPKDDTPGCTTEAKAFRDNIKEFEKADTVVIGISKCSIEKHCKFRDKYELSFALASDEEGDVCERYGVWVEKNMYGKKYMGIQRATFLINKEGEIVKSWPKVKVDGHAEDVLEAVKAL